MSGRHSAVEDDTKLYELTTRMKLQAEDVKRAAKDGRMVSTLVNGTELADTVLEFLKVSGWSKDN